ncbi:hypothetical protein MHN80_11895 [Gordonia McavH-238-E]|uniref:hypothetical protein n=1 Tax=Gordonia sp. McavH-238-E TaxID=2917736 RepID=UPI001EF42D9D|nr:hypothetical protein [Gordonia sp. McavH-238-E]MCG7633015.1 hypothetical protein [Gordonia sp. McavH-238-E]
MLSELLGNSAIMAAIGLGMIALTACALHLRRSCGAVTWLVVLLGVALTFDNVAVAVGRMVGFGDVLHAINLPRFWIHGLMTPLIVVAAAILVWRLGVRWRRSVVVVGALLVAALVVVGIVELFVALDLTPETDGDALRYANAAAAGPPIPALGTVLLLIAIGVSAWRQARSCWLLIGSVTMLVTAAAGMSVLWLGNFGELVLYASIVAGMFQVATTVRRSAVDDDNEQPVSADATAQEVTVGR